MAQAIKTMGAVLNEASDANLRDIESNRRGALTSVQLKGAIADQRYQDETRGREREYLDGVRNIYNEEMFVKKPVQAQPSGAIPTPDADGNFPAPQFSMEAIDPASRQGMEAIGRVQMRSIALRQKLGLAKPEEVQGLVDFRRKLASAGVEEDFQAAMKGDTDALARISDRFGLEGLQGIQSGQDENGFLNLFAVSSKADGTKTRVPIGHLAAAFSPEIDSMIKGSREAIKASDDMKTASADRVYKDRLGTAAIKNADTNADRLSARVLAQGEYDQFETIASKNEGRARVPVTVTDMAGEVVDVKDTQYDGMVRRIGGTLINTDNLDGAQAYNTAAQVLSKFGTSARTLHERDVQAAQAKVTEAEQNGDRNAIRAARRELDKLTTGEGPVRNWMRYREQMVEKLLERASGQQAIPAE